MRDEKKLLVTYGHDGPWDLDDPTDENRFTMEAWGAQMELRAIQRRNRSATVKTRAAGPPKGKPSYGFQYVRTVMGGKIDHVELHPHASAVMRLVARRVQRLAKSPKDATVSTRGEAVLAGTAWADGKGSTLQPQDATTARPVTFGLTMPATGKKATFTVDPAARQGKHAAQGRAPSPRLTSHNGSTATDRTATVAAANSPTDPVEDERTCSVPRNDPRNQAMQPKPRQVEWAVDQAITGYLNTYISRPANWKNLGMPAYSPQTLFLNPPLDGGSRVPAQVMLGVATQESNMWQAGREAVPGVTASPLIGNYYGIDLYDGDTSNDWDVNFAKADCGYGITQVTDHMRLAGREDGHGGTAWDYQTQRAAALDYTANIAAGLQILVSKWNETHAAGLIANNGDPLKPENWFYALWAYNSGFHPDLGDGSPWGVGWANNPANPEWDAGRLPFMENAAGGEDASAAARPQNWPYEEKVLGFAAHPPAFLESPGTLVPAFRPASWNGTTSGVAVAGSALYNRAHLKPDENLFCDASNGCDPSRISDGASNDTTTSGPCGVADFQCWWHKPVTWKTACSLTCGNELVRFNSTYPEEADGSAYPPNCTTSGLPAGALIVDDVPAGTPVVRPGCTNSWTNSGTFSFTFGNNGVEDVYPAKVDLHQLGAGFGGHFYFGHTRIADDKGERLKIEGAWRLNDPLKGEAKVMVHIPDHRAQTSYATYEIDTPHGTELRTVDQDGSANRWVSLGAFRFDNAAEVRLNTIASDGTGDEDIAFDAVAFVPGDYDLIPEIHMPDADANAREPAAQEPIETLSGSIFGAAKAPVKAAATVQEARRAGQSCAPQKGTADTQICIGPVKPPRTAKSLSAQATGDTSFCSANAAAKFYTRTTETTAPLPAAQCPLARLGRVLDLLAERLAEPRTLTDLPSTACCCQADRPQRCGTFAPGSTGARPVPGGIVEDCVRVFQRFDDPDALSSEDLVHALCQLPGPAGDR
ncbi:golvesin C-terminal-like domain-containing protein [Actinacidiphila oryziradicis]|uniref:golvesin C-terminal-like domain-containing protein n=1 Tax=Actinacidiphila oryziradicis TaxID=2571141 RepID=UPI001B800325|nr:hypothetical protein [Actinacidiphila oryziradicis]